jgi:endo-1,4-beta-xylanase
MITGIIGNGVVKTYAAEAQADNLISNGTFEDGTATGWNARGSATKLEATTEDKASGSYSMKITGRASGWHGPAYPLAGKVKLGKTYKVSLKVKAVPGQTETNKKVHISTERKIDGSTSYPSLKRDVVITDSAWTTIDTEVSLIDVTGDLTKLDLYVESPSTTLAFYVDDVSVVDANPIKTGNIVDNGTFEDGSKGSFESFNYANVIASDESAHTGKYSLKVTPGADHPDALASAKYNVKDKLVIGSEYKLTYWVKYTGDKATEQYKGILRTTPNGGSSSETDIGSVLTVNKDEWTKFTSVFTVPTADYSAISVQIRCTSGNSAFFVDDVAIEGIIPQPTYKIQNDIPSLKDVFSDYFPLGGAVEPSNLTKDSLPEQLVRKHYKVIVPGNQMKPDALQPTEGNFTYGDADKLVDYAIANNMEMRGHTLVWHSQIPKWFFQSKEDPTKPASKELLLQRLETHITTVLTHFKDKYGAKSPIKWWDVVNEVIDDNGNYRESDWYKIAGIDYIAKAFEVARKVDPSLKLYINDYNIERNNAKTQKLYDLVKELKGKGVPIDGVGMQMHITTDTSIDDIKASIEKYESLGVDIQVTELDLRILGTINQEGYQRQARLYKQVFDLLKTKKKSISMVMIWGITDNDSWYKDYEPLFFDKTFQAKDAYWAIVDPSKATVNRQNTNATSGTPIVGNKEENLWTTVKNYSINNFVKGLTGAKGKFQAMWDSKNLYIKARIEDSTVGTKDSIELFLDKNNSKTTTYQEDDKHYVINRDNSSNAGLVTSVLSDASGYSIQVAIPIEDIKPTLDTTVGFDIRINDDHNTGNVDSIAVYNDYGNRQDKNTAFFSNLNFEPAPKIANAAKGTIVIDGVKDEIWNNAEALSTEVWVTGTAGATAKAKLIWDENNLYVLADVTDNLLNKASENAHEQDSVEVFLDQNNEKTSSYQSDDGQYRVNFDNEQSFGGSTDKVGFKSATKVDGTNYVVEMAIPLSKVKAENGRILGFDIQVNNADASATRASVAMWNDPTGNSWGSTSNFGNVMLVDNNANGGNEPVVEDGTLSGITVDGTALSGFVSDRTEYTLELPVGATKVPEVTATATNTKANVVVTAATVLPGTTKVVVTTEAGTTKTYIINFTVKAAEIAKSSDATLSGIIVGGNAVSGFAADKTEYNIELTTGTKVVPEVAAIVTTPGKSNAVVTAAQGLPGATSIVVTAEDGTTKTYTINFTVKSAETIPEVTPTTPEVTQTTVVNTDASTIVKEIPKTGSAIDFNTLIAIASMMILSGISFIVVARRRKS